MRFLTVKELSELGLLGRPTADPRGQLAIRESHPGASGASPCNWRACKREHATDERNATFAVMATLCR
jgi:hypothetical protein